MKETQDTLPAADDRHAVKKAGGEAAKQWCKTAQHQDVIDVSGSRFEYGETLNDLIEDGYNVPKSSDVDFSWGFYKQVKGKVFHSLHRMPPGGR